MTKATVLAKHFGDYKYYARPAQLRAAAAIVASRIIAGQDPTPVQQIKSDESSTKEGSKSK